MMQVAEHIEIDTNKRFGKPVIRGTRITVYDVLNWMANGMPKKDIIKDFPELCEEKIRACLAYAANREKRFNIAL